MQKPLTGIIPPMITPLYSYDKLDIEGLHKLIEHLISGGVHGLFILGSNGEGPSLSYKLRKELISRTCEIVNQRIPVLVGISDTSIVASLEISEHSKASGADAVVVAPPYYYPLSQKELVEYFENLAGKLNLPFILYNLPSHTKVPFSLETIQSVKELGAIGIKDSSGDQLFLYKLIDEFKNSEDFSIFTGTEIFLPETIMNGGHGAVAGGANMFPHLFVKLYEAAMDRDLDTVDKLRHKVLRLYNTIYEVGKNSSRYTKGTKCGLSVMGICDDYMAPPFCRFGSKERQQIEKYIKEFVNTN